MTLPVTDESERLLQLTAKLYYENGLDQEAVAATLGISRTKVSRLLTRARQLGIVQIHIKGYDPRNCELEEQLKRVLGLRQAVVINTLHNTSTANIRRTIGYLAAHFLAELIQRHPVTGTAGGRTLSEVIQRIEPIEGRTDGTIVAMMGHIGPFVAGIDALELSYLLAQRFGRTHYTLNAPAFSPDVRTRDAFLSHAHVQQVYSLFSSLDLALVGIGALRESAWIERGVITEYDLEKLQKAGAAGEMVGRFFDSNGIECQTEYRDRVVSVPLSELSKVHEVVAVTNGPERAQAILAARRGNLIKSLVIDDKGAQAVLERARCED